MRYFLQCQKINTFPVNQRQMIKTLSNTRAFALFFLMSGLYGISFFQRVAVPGTIFNDIQKEFAICAGAVTALSSIYLFIYAGQQFFVGVLTDKFGGVKVTLVSGSILCVGSILFPFSDSLWLLYVSRALIGLGAGAMYLSGIKEIDRLFKAENFAPLVGIFCVIGYGGGLLGTRPFRGLVDAIGWRTALMAVACFSVILLFMTFFVGRKVHLPEEETANLSVLKNVKQVLTNFNIYPLLIAGMINFSLYFTIQSTIGSKFIGDFLDLPPSKATHYTFVMMLFTLTTMLVAGALSKMLGNKRKPFIIFASFNSWSAVSLLLCGVLFELPSCCFMLAYIMLAVSAGFTPITVSFIKELNSKDAAGLSVGTQNTATYVSVAISAGLIGFILDRFKKEVIITSSGNIIYPTAGYVAIFSMMFIFAIVSVLAALKTQETHGKNIWVS